jgi:hypothetical protein
MAVAKKKVGRPATKTARKRGRPATKKVGRPRKKKEQTIQEQHGYTFDPELNLWTRKVSFNDLSSQLAKLSVRVTTIERKIEEAERAGAKIHADLEKFRSHNEPKWVPWIGLGGHPDIKHAKVLIMRRDGRKSQNPMSVDSFRWDECGIDTIIAYAVV